MRKKFITEVSGVVAAPVDRVWRALLDDRPRYEMKTELGEHTVAYQGGWWYRGEWAVVADPEGTRVIHRVYDVAERLSWAVTLVNKFFHGFDEQTRRSFAEGLARIGERLGCAARLT
ncbi:hypothetical protein [Nonomuraea fuscirosea]|uniref:hypothetical protein n=1 Tax=Nonomuraea fuscirosea TaxID=1291556 RepID=UPI003436B78B